MQNRSSITAMKSVSTGVTIILKHSPKFILQSRIKCFVSLFSQWELFSVLGVVFCIGPSVCLSE